MGLFGWGKDEAVQASNREAELARDVAVAPTSRSALEQARGPADSGLNGAAQKLIQRLLNVGIDGAGPFDSAATVADAALKQAGGNVEKAISLVQRDHKQLAAAGGFATGLGGFVTMPVALPLNILSFYLLATRMTAATARLRGYDIATPEIRTATLLTLVGADSDDILRKAGVQAVAGGGIAGMALSRMPKSALMVINKAVGFRLIGRVGQGVLGRFGRAVPVVGGAIGAGVDLYMLGRIGEAGRREFPAVATAVANAAPGS